MISPEDLKLIAANPAFFRENVTVRGPLGPKLFKEIEQPFQGPVLADIEKAFLALRNDRMPPITRLWFEATKGCGKDTITAMELLWLIAFTWRPLEIEVGAADKVQADELRGAAKSILHYNEWLREFVEIQNFVILNPNTGTKCKIVPADEMGQHGSRPDVTIINEVTHHADDGFYQTMMDNAAKVNTNITIVLTNHGHLDTWQWNAREQARTSPLWAFHSYTQPAPWIPKETLEDRRKGSSSLRYRRLFEGQWVHQSEQALPSATIEAAIKLPSQHFERMPSDRIFGGVDIGVRRDRSALVACRRRPDEKLKLCHVQSWKPVRSGNLPDPQVDLQAVEDGIMAAHLKYSFHVVYYDPTQCEAIYQPLVSKGVPMERISQSSKSLQEMASAILQIFNSDDIELYRCQELIEDLKKLRFIEKANRFRIDAEADKEGHADTATALMLAILADLKNPWAWVDPFIRDKRQLAYSLDELVKKQHDFENEDGKIDPAVAAAAAVPEYVGELSRKILADQRPEIVKALEENQTLLMDNDDPSEMDLMFRGM